MVGVLDVCAGAADPGSVCQSVWGADGNPCGEGEEDGEGEVCRRRLHHNGGGLHLGQRPSHSGTSSPLNHWIWKSKTVKHGCVMVGSDKRDPDCVSSGCYIPSSWSELLQDVWDRIWRPQNTRREAVCLPELLGTLNEDHRCPHNGPRRQQGPGAAAQGGLSAGRHGLLTLLRTTSHHQNFGKLTTSACFPRLS